MKKLLRWGAMLGLLTSTVVGTSWLGNLPAIALPEEEIIKKLVPIPVFTITNAEGSPLLASLTDDNNNSASVAGVFISKQDADNFVQQLLNQDNPNLNDVQVTPVSLAEVYQMEQESQSNPDQPVVFDYVPIQSEVQSALQVLQNNGEPTENFNGVPLFLATGGADNGYLTIQQGGSQIIPLFFQKEQLEMMLGRLGEQQPDLAASVEIQVVNLQGVINLLRNSDDEQLNQIVLVPPRESIDYIRSLQNQ
jgi:nickel transport protein